MANKILDEQISKIKERIKMIEEQSFETPEGPSVPNEIPLDLDYVDTDSELVGTHAVKLTLMKHDEHEDIVFIVEFETDYNAHEVYPVSAEQVEPIHRQLSDKQFDMLLDNEELSRIIYSYQDDILRAEADNEPYIDEPYID